MRLTVGVLVVVLLCAGCSSGSGAPADGEATSGRDGSAPTPDAATPPAAGGKQVEGAAYRFTLPSDPAYTLFDEYVNETGSHVRSWRWSPTGAAPYCYISAVEQPAYPGAAQFPQSAITLFEGKRDPSEQVVRNEILDPPPEGTRAAVAQEKTAEGTTPDGTRVTLRTVVREQLTPGNTLLQFISAAPQELVERCGIVAAAESFGPTGREAPIDPATDPATEPSPSTSGEPQT